MFVPPHLRILHVTREPLLFHDVNVWGNLVYGEMTEEDSDPERVFRICKRMGMSEQLVESIHANAAHVGDRDTGNGGAHAGTGHSVARREIAEQKAASMNNISYTDRCLIHLARALIVNPDFLIIHKPLTHFNGVDMERVLEVLREFVDLRGLESPVELRRQRRPRT